MITLSTKWYAKKSKLSPTISYIPEVLFRPSVLQQKPSRHQYNRTGSLETSKVRKSNLKKNIVKEIFEYYYYKLQFVFLILFITEMSRLIPV